MQRRHKRLIVISALVIAVAALLWYQSRPKPVAVTVAPVERARVEATVANTRAGTVETCQRARLAPALGGQVARLLVKKGDTVDKGQALMEFWNDDLAAHLRLAESGARAAQKGWFGQLAVHGNSRRLAGKGTGGDIGAA